jgi:phosphate transport system protein
VCKEVIHGDDEVDRLYLDVERRILHLFALQTPVASDLRLLTALLHINLHLDRGDQAVNLAKITTAADGLPQNPTVLRDLEEVGTSALGWWERRWRPWPAAVSPWPAGCLSWTIPSMS